MISEIEQNVQGMPHIHDNLQLTMVDSNQQQDQDQY
jgi:hypothetical protein